MRLGDLDALKDDFECVGFNDYDDYNRALRIIDNAPTVEALKDITEVHCDITKEQLLNSLRPQGEWKIEETPQYSEIRCPFCQFSPNEVWLPNFCSNCGAKLKKGGAE